MARKRKPSQPGAADEVAPNTGSTPVATPEVLPPRATPPATEKRIDGARARPTHSPSRREAEGRTGARPDGHADRPTSRGEDGDQTSGVEDADDDEILSVAGGVEGLGEPALDEAAPVDPAVAAADRETTAEGGQSAGAAGARQTGLARVRDPVALFLSEARRYPRLSEDEERRLGLAVRERGDKDAARRLVVHNLRLVVAIAYQYRRAWANILDLFQEGSLGLVEAVRRWEPTLGPRFGSYAAYWIRAFVLKFLMTNSRLIHVGNTRAGRKLFFRLERERQKLLAAGFEPTPKLLAAKLDVDEKELDEVRQHLDSRELSLDPPGRAGGDADEGYALAEKIPLEQASPEDRAATAEMSDALHRFMDDFAARLADERERAIWREHLAAEEPVPLGDLGARFGVTKQRMGQIADKLKKRFREEIVAGMGADIRTAWLGDES